MEGNIEDWKKAGKIAAEVLEHGRSLIKPGASYLEVTEKIENKIKELGAEPAFPPQMAINEVAAHFTVNPDEDIKFEEQLVSLDIGIHVNGCIGDTACTVDLSKKYEKLVLASEEALANAIEIIKAGTKLSEIGKTIEQTAKKHGFVPVKNLTGHGLEPYNIHSYPSIPNYDNEDDTELEDGQIIAIEPFITDGAGMIYESGKGNIFAQIDKKPVRSNITREVLKKIESYEGLPFTTRWLAKEIPIVKVRFGLMDLLKNEIIKEYPPLPDVNRGFVSQSEHTLLVKKDGCEILTSR